MPVVIQQRRKHPIRVIPRKSNSNSILILAIYLFVLFTPLLYAFTRSASDVKWTMNSENIIHVLSRTFL